jgi:hypothetical protein
MAVLKVRSSGAVAVAVLQPGDASPWAATAVLAAWVLAAWAVVVCAGVTALAHPPRTATEHTSHSGIRGTYKDLIRRQITADRHSVIQ